MNILNKIKQSKVTFSKALSIKTIDMHTGGEPLRVIIDGYPEIKGNTILEKRNYTKMHLDDLRKALMFEPRGHADMYGVILTQACSQGCDFGVIFIHNEGYSTMCGHATIAITKLAVLQKWVDVKKPITKLSIDAPCGVLHAKAYINEEGEVTKVSFKCVPSFALALDEKIEVESLGEITYDLAYGGAFYAYVDADKIGLSLDKDNYDKIISYGRKIKKSIVEKKDNIKHPFEEDLSFLYGTIFISLKSSAHSKNVCVFADGEVDRSPTGSGVSGRVAIHYKKNELEKNQSITIESILNTSFEVKVLESLKYAHHDAIIPEVTGNAYITGEHNFLIDNDDELKYGFFLR